MKVGQVVVLGDGGGIGSAPVMLVSRAPMVEK